MNGRLENDLKIEEKINNLLNKLPEYVAEWNFNLKASQKTAATRFDYCNKIQKFLQYINKENTREIKPEDINVVHVQKFFIEIQTKKKKDGTIKETSDSYRYTFWYALHNFFDYMAKRHYIAENLVDIVDRPQNHDLDRINEHRILLTSSDFSKIYEACCYDDNVDMWVIRRNKAIFTLLMTTGMRRTAMMEINVEDVDEANSRIVIIDKKKKRHVYDLSVKASLILHNWMESRKYVLREARTDNDALFINENGERITQYTLDGIIRRYSKRALGYEISPHKIRSGCASILYERTHDIEFVRKAIGHANIKTTRRYIVTEGNEREKANNLLSDIL